MKVLGIKQFHQKTFKLLEISSKFKGLLGNVPDYFIAVIYGFSGQGKTELCIQLARELAYHGKVAWLSYEQGHGYDLQLATARNRMEEISGSFLIIDPNEQLKLDQLKGVREDKVRMLAYFRDLVKFIKKRNSPKVIFIDSLDYTKFTWLEYVELKELAKKKKKIIIFIAHSSKAGVLKKAISEQIIFDGGMGFHVRKYICYPEKNRFGGNEPYVIWEEEARKRNPTFFAKQAAAEPAPKKPPHKRKPKTESATENGQSVDQETEE